jgi:hypothetical protein
VGLVASRRNPDAADDFGWLIGVLARLLWRWRLETAVAAVFAWVLAVTGAAAADRLVAAVALVAVVVAAARFEDRLPGWAQPPLQPFVRASWRRRWRSAQLARSSARGCGGCR